MPVHEQFTSGATGPRENEPELSQTSQVQGTARVVREDGAKKKKAKSNLSMKKCGEMCPVEKHLSCDLKSFVFPWKTNSITVIKNINKGRADSWVSDKSTNHLLLIYCHMKFSQGDFFQYDTGTWNRWPQWKVLQIQPCLELCPFGEKADLFGVIAMPREISSVMLFPYWYLLLFAVAGNHWKHSRPAFTWYR